MRIVISSPPKMGNKWIKCLLGRVYNLHWVIGEDSPSTNVEQFINYVQDGKFLDNTIFHQHCKYKPSLCDAIDSVPAHLVTIVRDPYDAFVSMYHWIQTRTDSDMQRGRIRPKERPRNVMYGKPIDDESVLDFLSTDYGEHIRRADDWIHSGRAIVVRYEDLHRDTIDALTHVTDQIEPVDPERIKLAVEACTADNMRNMSKRMSTHVRAATVGDSRGKLSEAHLKIFRDKYADLLGSLGYDVR